MHHYTIEREEATESWKEGNGFLEESGKGEDREAMMGVKMERLEVEMMEGESKDV